MAQRRRQRPTPEQRRNWRRRHLRGIRGIDPPPIEAPPIPVRPPLDGRMREERERRRVTGPYDAPVDDLSYRWKRGEQPPPNREAARARRGEFGKYLGYDNRARGGEPGQLFGHDLDEDVPEREPFVGPSKADSLTFLTRTERARLDVLRDKADRDSQKAQRLRDQIDVLEGSLSSPDPAPVEPGMHRPGHEIDSRVRERTKARGRLGDLYRDYRKILYPGDRERWTRSPLSEEESASVDPRFEIKPPSVKALEEIERAGQERYDLYEYQGSDELITPRKFEGESPEIVVGGRTGVVDFSVPPEINPANGKREHLFRAEDGFERRIQLERHLQGGRWEDQPDAPDIYERLKSDSTFTPGDIQGYLDSAFGRNHPAVPVVYEALQKKVPFSELKKWLGAVDTYKQVDEEFSGVEVEPQQTYRTRVPGSRFVPETDVIVPDTGESLGLTGDPLWREQGTPISGEDRKRVFELTAMARDEARTDADRIESAREAVAISDRFSGEPASEARALLAKLDKRVWTEEDLRNAGITEPDAHRALQILGDWSLALVQGSVGVVSAGVEMADWVIPGDVRATLKNMGFDPHKTEQLLDNYYSNFTKKFRYTQQEADGLLEHFNLLMGNPSQLVNSLLRTLPLLAMQGAIAGRGVKIAQNLASRLYATKRTVQAGDTYRGLASAAGQSEKMLRSVNNRKALIPGEIMNLPAKIGPSEFRSLGRGVEGLLAAASMDPTSSGWARLATAISTSAFGAIGGTGAKVFGTRDIDDVLTYIGSGRISPQALASIARRAGPEALDALNTHARTAARRIGRGGATEMLEETGQSSMETLIANLDAGRPAMEGVDQAAVEGGLVGFMLGAAMNVPSGSTRAQAHQEMVEKAAVAIQKVESGDIPGGLQGIEDIKTAQTADPFGEREGEAQPRTREQFTREFGGVSSEGQPDLKTSPSNVVVFDDPDELDVEIPEGVMAFTDLETGITYMPSEALYKSGLKDVGEITDDYEQVQAHEANNILAAQLLGGESLVGQLQDDAKNVASEGDFEAIMGVDRETFRNDVERLVETGVARDETKHRPKIMSLGQFSEKTQNYVRRNRERIKELTPEARAQDILAYELGVRSLVSQDLVSQLEAGTVDISFTGPDAVKQGERQRPEVQDANYSRMVDPITERDQELRSRIDKSIQGVLLTLFEGAPDQQTRVRALEQLAERGEKQLKSFAKGLTGTAGKTKAVAIERLTRFFDLVDAARDESKLGRFKALFDQSVSEHGGNAVLAFRDAFNQLPRDEQNILGSIQDIQSEFGDFVKGYGKTKPELIFRALQRADQGQRTFKGHLLASREYVEVETQKGRIERTSSERVAGKIVQETPPHLRPALEESTNIGKALNSYQGLLYDYTLGDQDLHNKAVELMRSDLGNEAVDKATEAGFVPIKYVIDAIAADIASEQRPLPLVDTGVGGKDVLTPKYASAYVELITKLLDDPAFDSIGDRLLSDPGTDAGANTRITRSGRTGEVVSSFRGLAAFGLETVGQFNSHTQEEARQARMELTGETAAEIKAEGDLTLRDFSRRLLGAIEQAVDARHKEKTSVKEQADKGKKEGVVLVACCKTKATPPGSGKKLRPGKLYTSPLFKKSMTYADQFSQAFILSAQHGLLDPDGKPLESYDKHINQLSAREKRDWADRVAGKFISETRIPKDYPIVILAGKAYTDVLIPRLRELGYTNVVLPLERLGSGKRLQKLDELIKAGREEQTKGVEAVKGKDKPTKVAKEKREADKAKKAKKARKRALDPRKRALDRRNADAIDARRLEELHSDLLEQARQTDPNVDEQDVRAAVDRAVEFWQEEQVEAEGIGGDARTLLRTIAGFGGLSSKREAGNWHDGKDWHPPKGTRLEVRNNEEIEAIRSHSIQGVGQQDLLGIHGVFQQVGGKTLEEMAEALVGDGSGRFDHLIDPQTGNYDSSKLWDELNRIVTKHKGEDLGLSQGFIPSAQDLAHKKGALKPGTRWWEAGATFGPPRAEPTEAEGIAARIEGASSLEEKAEILNKVVEFITRKADEGDAQATAYLAFLMSGPESFSGHLSDDVRQSLVDAVDRLTDSAGRPAGPFLKKYYGGGEGYKWSPPPFSTEWDGWMLAALAKEDEGDSIIVPSQVLAERFGDISFVDEAAQISFESDTPDTNDLRQAIMQTLLAFDVKLDVLDLQVRVNTSDTKKAKAFAFFEPNDMSITLGGIIHQQTFAHEFSHYVDVLFGLALGFDPKREVYLSEVSSKDEALRSQILNGPNGQAGLDFLDQFNEFKEKHLNPMVLESTITEVTDYAEAFAKLGEWFVGDLFGAYMEYPWDNQERPAPKGSKFEGTDAFSAFSHLLASYSALEGAVERKKQLAGARDAVRGLSREALSEILESEKAGKDAPSHRMDPRPAPVSIVNEFLAMDVGPFIEYGFTRLPAWFEERKENADLLKNNPRLLTHPSAESWKENEALIESWNKGNDSILKMLRDVIQSLPTFGNGSISLIQKIAEGLPGTSGQNMKFLTDESRANLANPSNPKGGGDGRTAAGQARRIWEHPDTPRVIIDALFELWNNPRGVTPRIKRQSLEEDLADVRSFDAQLAEMSDPKFGSRDRVERVFESVWNSARDVGVEQLLSELRPQELSIFAFLMRQHRGVITRTLKDDLAWKEVFSKAPPFLLATLIRGLLVRDVRGNRQKEIVEFLAALPSSSSDMIATSTNTLTPRTNKDPLQRFLEAYQRDTKPIINPIQEVEPLPKMVLDQNPIVVTSRRIGEPGPSWAEQRHQVEMDSSRIQEMFDRAVEAGSLVPGTPSEDAIELIVLNNIIDVPRLLGVSPEAFRRAIAPRTGGNVQALQEKLNHRVPLIAKWTGLQNLAFLANKNVSHADLELLVNSINVESRGRDGDSGRRMALLARNMREILGGGEIAEDDEASLARDVMWGEESGGQALRNALVRAFMAINSRIDLSFVNVSVDSAPSSNPAAQSIGLWEPSTLTLHAALELFDNTGPEQLHNTIAHEMGHVLDYMWGVELGLGTRPAIDIDRSRETITGKRRDIRSFNPGLLSAFMSVVDSNGMSLVFRDMENKGVSDVRVEWTKRYLNFIDRISRVSRISSRAEDSSFGYWQRAEEVFARFMDSWMRWQETQVAGRRVRAESATYGDKFTQAHFEEFVRLLQEKAYVDAVDGNPNQVTPGDTRGKSLEALMSKEIPTNAAPPLYSTIEKYVRDEMGVKESIRSLLQTLKSRPVIRALPAKTAKEAKRLGSRIKENHLKWSNIEPWLSGLLEKGQTHVTRDEVIGFLQASALDIVVSEAVPKSVSDEIRQFDDPEEGSFQIINPDDINLAAQPLIEELLNKNDPAAVSFLSERGIGRPNVRYAGSGVGMQLPEGADPSGYRELSLILRPRHGDRGGTGEQAVSSAVSPYAGHGFPKNTTVWVRFQERPHAGTPTPPEETLREVLERRPDVRNRFGSQGAEVVHGAIQELIDDIIAEGGITRSNALEEMTGWAITLDIDNDVNQVSESPRAHLTSSEAGKGLWMPGRRQIFTDESQRISAADFLTEGIPESVQGIPYMGSALQVGRHQRGVGSETSNTRKLENQQLQVSSHYDPFTGSGLGTGGYRVAGTEFLDSLALDDKGRKRIESVLESAEKEGYSATRRSREIFRALAQETGAVFTADMTPRQYLAQIFKDQTFGRGFDSPLHQHVLSENRGDYVDRSGRVLSGAAGSDTEFVDRSDPAFRYDPRDSMLATPTSSRRGIPRFTVSVTYGSDLLPASQLLPQSDPGSVKASDLTDKLVRESNLIGDKEALLDTIPPDRLVYLPNMNGRIFNRLFGETFVDMALDGNTGIRTLGGVNLSGRGPRELSDFLFNHKDFVPMTQTPQVRDSAGKVAALIASSIEGGAERKISRNRELKNTLDFHIWITDATATEPFEKWIPLKDATREQLIEASESGQFTFISGMHRNNPDTSVRGDRTDEAWLKLLQGQMTIFSMADEFSIPTLELTEKFGEEPVFYVAGQKQEQLDKKALEGDIDELYKSLFSVDSLGSGGRPTILELGYSPMYVGGAYTGVELNTENVRAGYKGGAREMRSSGVRFGEKSVGVAPSYGTSNRPPRSQFRDDRSPREAVIQHYLDVAIKVLERSLNPYESTPTSKTMDRLREADKKRYDIGLSPDALIPVTEENKEELFAALDKLQMFNSRLNRLISERDASSRIPIHRTPKEAPPDIPRTLLDRILADLKSPDGKFLLIGEIQSDWHQKYASTGFSTGRFLKLLKAAGLKREDLFAPFAGVTSHPDVKGALRAEEQRKEKLSVVARALIDQHVKDDRNIPSAERLKNRLTKKTEVTLAREFPHLTNWEKVQLFTLVSEALRRPEVDSPFATTHVELALKRMVYYAAQNGFTSMGWVGAESKAAAVGGGARGEANVSWGSRLALLEPDGKDSKFLEEYTFLDSQDVKGEDIGQFEGSRENEIDKFVRKYNLIEPAVWEALSNEVKDNFMKFVGETIDSTGVSTTLGGVPAESVRAKDPRLGTKDPDYDFKALGDKRSVLARVQGMLGLEAPTESGAAIDPITLSGLSTIQFMAVDASRSNRLETKDPDFIAVNSYTGRWINGTRKFRHDKALGEQVIFGLAEGTSPSAMLGAEISAAVANSDGPGHGTIMMGGDGKAVQYDTSMPKYARKFLKHFGVKLQHRLVPASRSEGPDFLAEEGAVTDRMSVDRGSAFDYWYFEITQEMRDSVLSGESIINAYPSQRPTVAYADVEKVARKRRQKVSQTINQFEDAGYVIEGKPGLLEEERQPTLLGDVRNQDIETPEVADAPFSLTQEVEEKEDDQGGLFGAIPPSKKRQAYTPEGETRRAREVPREIDTSRVSPDRRVSLTDDPADGSSPTELVGLRMDEINEIIEQLLATVSESGQKEIWPKVIPGLVRREGARGSKLARHVHRYEPKIEMPRAFYDLYVEGAGDVIGDRKVEDLPQIGEALVISDIDVQLERDTPFFKDMLKEAERVLAAANDIRTRPGGEARIAAAQEFVDRFEEEIRVRDYINVEYANELFMPTFDEEAGEYVEPDKKEIAGIMGRMLGHLIDWIPTRSMSGSLVSKLKALKNLTRRSIATSNGVIKDSELREEMKAFSEMWRPLRDGSRESLSKTKKGQSYLAYRDSAVELFADGWSALLVDPYFVKENAPKFFNTVMDTLDEPGNKEIKKAYIQMLHIATGGADSRDRASLDRLDKNLRIAERKVRDVLAETRMALESDQTWSEKILRGFVDKHTWFYQRMAELERKGVKVEEGEDPSIALSEMAYISGPIQALLSRSFEKMYRNIREAGIPWHDYNLHVQMLRVASGDRLDIASPGVLTQEQAQADMAVQNEELTEKYGEDAVRIFEEADDLLSETVAEVMQEALKSGTLSQERYEDLMERRAEGRFYVTFRAVTHLWDDVSPFIQKQEGMIGPVAGAADETMVKLVRMSRFAQRNTITRTAMDFIDKYFPNDSLKPVTEGPGDKDVTYEEVRGKKEAKFKETTGKGPHKRHLILFWVNGEAQGRYVDEVVASSFNQQENETLRALVKVFSTLNSGFLRPVYTMANPAFQISNFFRDWWRSYKSQSERTGEGFYNPFTKKIQKLPWWVGGQYMQKLVGKTTGRGPNYVSFLQHAKSYFGEAHRLARARAFGERERRGFMLKFGPLEKRIFDRDLTETQREESKRAIEDLMAARQSKAFSVTMNEFIKGQTPEDQEFAEGIEVYLRRYGSHPQRGLTDAERKKIHAPFFQLVDFIKNVGDYIETLPKAAALYRAAEGTGINESAEAILAIPAAKKRFIRERVGSPDFLAGGDQKVWSNEIFIFSNAITQAWRGDIRTATDPQTRLGYWWKTTVFTIFPKVLMAMGANGLLGGGDDEEYRPGEEGNWRQALPGFFRSISNYMKMNYIIVPLFRNPNGNVEYVSLPQDDVGRVIGGLTYNLVDQLIKNDDEGIRSLVPIIDTMWSAVDYAGAQLPTMHPLVTTAAQTLDLVSLMNDRTGREEGPQDYFFDRPIVPPSERGFALEMRRREGDFLPSAEGYIPSFLAYQWNQWGGRIIFTAGQREATLTEQTGLSFIQKLRGQAVIGSMVGRLVRESDYGSTEATQIIGRPSELANDAQNRELERLARGVVREYIDTIGMEAMKGQLRGDGVGGERALDTTVSMLADRIYADQYGQFAQYYPNPPVFGRDMTTAIRNDVQNAIVSDTGSGRINGIDYWTFRNFSPQGKADALMDLLDREGDMKLFQTANTLINLGALTRSHIEDRRAPEDWMELRRAFIDGGIEHRLFLEGRQ